MPIKKDLGMLNVMEFGAKGDGTTDDTLAFQAALNALQDRGTLYVPTGIYLVKNLVIPDKRDISILSDGSQLKAAAASKYVIATHKYVNNVAQAGQPIKLIKGLTIDGNNVTDVLGMVIQTWKTTVKECDFLNCKNGLVMTTVTDNGTKFSGSTLVNNRVLDCNASNCTGIGIFVQDPDRNKATDFFIENNFAYTCAVGLQLESCAGTLVKGNHFYNNSTRDMYVSIGSLAFRIIGNYFESAESLYMNEVNVNTSTIFSNNTVKGKVKVYASNTGVFQSTGNDFRGDGNLHNEWNTKLTMFSIGDSFESEAPYRSNNASAPSVIIARDSVSMGIGNTRLMNGKANLSSQFCATEEYSDTTPAIGRYLDGSMVFKLDAVAGDAAGWICTSPGRASNTPWAASTAYTVGQQVNANNKVYECTVAGTTNTTAPSHGSGTATNGTVTWSYVGVLAVFREYGLISVE